MGLAISLISTVPEKVWYHQCKNRGVNCHNTNLINKGGCSKWFNELEVSLFIRFSCIDFLNVLVLVRNRRTFGNHSGASRKRFFSPGV